MSFVYKVLYINVRGKILGTIAVKHLNLPDHLLIGV